METFNFKDYKEKLEKRSEAAKKSKISNERQSVVKEFLDILNSQRGGQFKPLTPARLGVMFRFMSTGELKAFLANCKDAQHFSKFFWYSFKQNYEPRRSFEENA